MDLIDWLLTTSDEKAVDIVLSSIYEASKSHSKDVRRGFKKFVQRTGISLVEPRKTHADVAVKAAAILFVPALIVAVFFTFKYISLRSDNQALEWVELNTSYSENKDITLSDGSLIHMEPCSKIIYPERFNGKKRKVFLVGEAFFDVASNPEVPFVVSTGSMEVNAFGTKFNVIAYQESLEDEVALVEGKVSASFKDNIGDLYLLPGELLKYNKTTSDCLRSGFTTKYYEQLLKSGSIFFNNESLGDIASKLSRRFNVRIVIDSPELSKERYFASFINNETLDEILKSLNMNNSFSTIENDGIIRITKK